MGEKDKMKIKLVKTCFACPEQYDLFFEDKMIAYIRLRWGRLYCSVPDVSGKIIYDYQFEDTMKGMFDDENERKKYLKIIKKKINEYYTELNKKKKKENKK